MQRKLLYIFIMLSVIVSAPSFAEYELPEDSSVYSTRQRYDAEWITMPPREPCWTNVGYVLSEISDTKKKELLAEQWIQTMQQSYSRKWDLHEGWLKLQQEELQFRREKEQLRTENIRLRVELEKLRRENIKLEKENLQLRLKLKEKDRNSQDPNESSDGKDD